MDPTNSGVETPDDGQDSEAGGEVSAAAPSAAAPPGEVPKGGEATLSLPPGEEGREVANRWFVGLYSALVTALAVAAVIQIWSQAKEFEGGGSSTQVEVDILWFSVTTTENTVVLIYVAALGALGAAIAALRAVAKWSTGRSASGERLWDVAYTWWYLVRPLIGSGLAIIVYLALVGTLLGSLGAGDSLNIAGIGAIAALSGLFSKMALAKLQEVFKTVFSVQSDPDLAPREHEAIGDTAVED